MAQSNVSAPNLNGMNSLVTIHQCFFHNFSNKQKVLKDICDCSIYQHIEIQGTNMPNQYFKIGNFIERIDDKTIVVVQFQNSTSYIFQTSSNQDCVLTISFDNDDENVKHFQNILKEATNLVMKDQEKYSTTSLKNKVQTHCQELTTQIIQNNQTISTVGKIVGGILGSVSKIVVQPTAKAEVLMNNGFQQIAKKTLSDENRGKWSVLKQKASNMNEIMTSYYKPIDNKFKELTSLIGNAFQTSQNKYVKGIKNFGRQTARVLNKNYLKAQKTQPVPLAQKTSQSISSHQQSTSEINTNQ